MIIILRIFFVLLSIIISWFTFINFSLKAALISGISAAVISLALVIVIEFISHTFSTRNLVASLCGLFLGLLIAYFVIEAFSFFTTRQEVTLQMFIKLVIYHICGFSVMIFFLIKNEDIGLFDKLLPRSVQGSGEIVYKVLDTSVIIDGRIADLCDTGFVEGVLVIPNFVLDELQMIADSADSIKRNRGRRGLDILNKMQKDQSIKVKISDMDWPEIHEVDAKLVKLGKIMNAKIVTNDFNLNKVAEFHGVQVLNINQLSNALKPIVLPGEEMHISLIKEGKDQNQAVGYLDDGTMIVVENGRKNLHEVVDVVVTSVLQTTAGRMIFARIKNEDN